MTYTIGSEDDEGSDKVEIVITLEARDDIVYTLVYYVQSALPDGGYTYGDPVLTVLQRGTANDYLSPDFIKTEYVDGLPNLSGYREEDFRGVTYGYYTATMYGEPVDTESVYIAGDRSTTIRFYYALRLIPVTIDYDDSQIESVVGEGNYAFGAEVTISATPKKGYRFVSWEIIKGGDEDNKLIVTQNVYTLIIDDDIEIKLNVESDVADTTYTVRYYLETLGQEDYGEPFREETLDGVTESEVDIEPLLTNFDGYRYSYHTVNNDDNIILGDGSTVVNIYYLLEIVEFEVSFETGITSVTVQPGSSESPLELIGYDEETNVYTYRTKHTAKVSLSVTIDENGYEFSGWRRNGRLISGSSVTVNYLLDITYDTETLSATASEKQIIIIYEPNNGSTQSRPVFATFGDVETIIDNPFSHSGRQEFLGWSTTPDGDVIYYAGDEVTIDEHFMEGTNGSSITLYAVWREKEPSRWWIWLLLALLILLIIILIVIWILSRRKKDKNRIMAKQ